MVIRCAGVLFLAVFVSCSTTLHRPSTNHQDSSQVVELWLGSDLIQAVRIIQEEKLNRETVELYGPDGKLESAIQFDYTDRSNVMASTSWVDNNGKAGSFLFHYDFVRGVSWEESKPDELHTIGNSGRTSFFLFERPGPAGLKGFTVDTIYDTKSGKLSYEVAGSDEMKIELEMKQASFRQVDLTNRSDETVKCKLLVFEDNGIPIKFF